MNNDSYRRLAQAGLAPLLEDVPPGPEWEELMPPTQAVPALRRRPAAWVIGFGTATVVLIVFGIATLLSTSDLPSTLTTVAQGEPRVSSSLPTQDQQERTWPAGDPPTVAFAVELRGEGKELNAVLPNGDAFAWRFPEDLPIETATASIKAWITEDNANNPESYDIVLAQGDVATWFGNADLVSGELDHDGVYVYTRRDLPSGSYLVITGDAWIGWIFSNYRISDQDAERLANLISIGASSSGWPLLSLDPPLRLAAPSEFPPLALDLWHPSFVVSLYPEGCIGSASEGDADGSYVVRCVEGGPLRVDVSVQQLDFGSAEEIANGVEPVDSGG